MSAVGRMGESASKARMTGYPAGSTGFDLTASLLGVWFMVGLFIDGYAHNHGAVDDTFFTPYHAVLYSSIAVTGLFLGFHQIRNSLRGYAFAKALPRGYLLSLIGAGLFMFGGLFDLWWHETFGFEVNIEALLSPAHLLLASAGFLIATGALRSAFTRFPAGTTLNWRDATPIVIALLVVLSGITFFLQFNNVFTNIEELVGIRPDTGHTANAVIGGLLVSASMVTGIVLFAVRSWRLPAGAITVIVTVNAVLMLILVLRSTGAYAEVLVAALAAGLLGDLLVRAPLDAATRARLIGFVVPFVTVAGVFIVLLLTARIWMTIHLWLGTAFMAGIAGVFLSYLAVPPVQVSETAQRGGSVH